MQDSFFPKKINETEDFEFKYSEGEQVSIKERSPSAVSRRSSYSIKVPEISRQLLLNKPEELVCNGSNLESPERDRKKHIHVYAADNDIGQFTQLISQNSDVDGSHYADDQHHTRSRHDLSHTSLHSIMEQFPFAQSKQQLIVSSNFSGHSIVKEGDIICAAPVIPNTLIDESSVSSVSELPQQNLDDSDINATKKNIPKSRRISNRHKSKQSPYSNNPLLKKPRSKVNKAKLPTEPRLKSASLSELNLRSQKGPTAKVYANGCHNLEHSSLPLIHNQNGDSSTLQHNMQEYHFQRNIQIHRKSQEEIDINDTLYGGLECKISLKKNASEWALTVADIKDIILKQTIPCSILCCFLVGLPLSGNSKLLQKFLSEALLSHPQLPHHEQYQCNEESLSSYEVSILQCLDGSIDQLLWFGQSDCLKDIFTCGAKILYENFLRQQKITMIKDESDLAIFTNQSLNRHIYSAFQNISSCINNDLNSQLKSMIASGATFMKNLNVGLNRGILEVLSVISRHIKVNLGLIFLPINNIDKLNDMPIFTQSRSTVIKKETNLLCIAEYANLLKKTSCENFITFVITCDKGTSERDKKEAKEKLQQLLVDEVKSKRLHLSEVSVITVDESSHEDLKELKTVYDKAIQKQCTERNNIKLSWLFLLNAMVSDKRVVVNYNEFKSIATDLNIGPDEYNDFLQVFTNSMTILHLSEYEQMKSFVILQPVKFMNALSLFFQKPVPAEFNGIFTMEQIYDMVPDRALAKAIIDTLCSFGLATLTNENKVNRKLARFSTSPRQLLFVPLAKSVGLSQNTCMYNSLHIVPTANSLTIPLDPQGFFTSSFLKLENVSLEITSEINQIKSSFLTTIKNTDRYFQLVCQPTHIEVFLEYCNDTDGLFENVLCCCIESMEKVQKITQDFTFSFALLCKTPGQHHGTKYGNLIKEHLVDGNSKLCYHCEVQPGLTRTKWKEVTCKVFDDIKKEKDRVSAENLFKLARDLGLVVKTTQSLRSLAVQLGVQRDRQLYSFISPYPQWQRCLILLWTWEKKVGTDNATKEELKKALHRLGHTSDVLK